MPSEVKVSRISALSGKVSRFLSSDYGNIVAQDKDGNFLRVESWPTNFSSERSDQLISLESLGYFSDFEDVSVTQAVCPSTGMAYATEGNVVVVNERNEENAVSTLFAYSYRDDKASLSGGFFKSLGLDVKDILNVHMEDNYLTFLMSGGEFVVVDKDSFSHSILGGVQSFKLSLPKFNGEYPVDVIIREGNEEYMTGFLRFVHSYNIYAIYRSGGFDYVVKLLPIGHRWSLELGPEVLKTKGVLGCDYRSMFTFYEAGQKGGLRTNKGSNIVNCDSGCGMCGDCYRVDYGFREQSEVRSSERFSAASMSVGHGKCIISKDGRLGILVPKGVDDLYFVGGEVPMEIKRVVTHEPIESAAMSPGGRGLALTTSGNVLGFSLWMHRES